MTVAASESGGAGARRSAPGPVRPAARLARSVRRVGWAVAAALAVLMGGGFSWTLAEAAKAPPTTAPLPASEQQLVRQSKSIAAQIGADRQRLAALQAQVAQLTGSAGSGGAPSAGRQMPSVHGFTGAS